jgi:site-specific DNA-cytosine methylase
VLKSLPTSITTKPVTQTADVEEKRASTNRRFPLVAEKGNHRRIPPVRITAAKLRTKILVGERCLEKKVLIRIRIFNAISQRDFILKTFPCQSFSSVLKQGEKPTSFIVSMTVIIPNTKRIVSQFS